MTVEDLIRILEQYPSDTKVFVECEGDFSTPEIDYDQLNNSIAIW